MTMATCPDGDHDVDETATPYTCRRCGASICAGCGLSFDIVCDACDGRDFPPDSRAGDTDE